jgi:hypothetical protein
MSIPMVFAVLRLMTNSYLVGGKSSVLGQLTVAEFGSDIGLKPSVYLNNEPPPGYRHCRGAHHCALNGLALPMARHLIIDRRSAPR